MKFEIIFDAIIIFLKLFELMIVTASSEQFVIHGDATCTASIYQSSIIVDDISPVLKFAYLWIIGLVDIKTSHTALKFVER